MEKRGEVESFDLEINHGELLEQSISIFDDNIS